MKKLLEWIGHSASIAGILSFLGFSFYGVLALLGRPVVSVVALCIGFLGFGVWLGRRIERKVQAQVPEANRRSALLDLARGAADKLTREPWAEFPAWGWTIASSKHAMTTVMERVEERLADRLTDVAVDELVRESVRMYISEALARRAASQHARQESVAMQILRRQTSWVHGWRHR